MGVSVWSLFCGVVLKPDTHNETFVCTFCMQLLCVSYTTVQTMEHLYATSHYLLLFPAKIVHIRIKPLSTWCLLRRTKSDPVKSNLVRSPSSPSCGTLLRIYSTGTLLVVAIALLTFLCLKMENYCRSYCT